MNILEYVKNNNVIADGAFGTYYTSKYGDEGLAAPEFANVKAPDRVIEIHRDYICSGAEIIRTNTFAANTVSMGITKDVLSSYIVAAVENARAAVRQVKQAEAFIYIAGDIGPLPVDSSLSGGELTEQYIYIGEALQDCGVDVLWFETFPDFSVLMPVVRHLKERGDTPIMVSFCVNQFGYSNAGLSARALLSSAAQCPEVDMVGLNCGVGPYHMKKLTDNMTMSFGKPVAVMPNAGYPRFTQSRLVFNDNKESFAERIGELFKEGVDIAGGCCGTSPKYIQLISQNISDIKHKKYAKKEVARADAKKGPKDNFLEAKRNDPSHKLIAVELAPPADADDAKVLDAAHILKKSGVDVVTFPDSPSGRTRADSILMAEKIHRETGLRVMPHICCRDKNAIAIRGSILGAKLNGIKDFLVITGDPVPVMFRQTTRSVFNFDSIGMMNLINSMNEEVLCSDRVTFGGAINQNRPNLHIELDRIKRKMAAGAEFFLTQPVFTRRQAEILRGLKEETGALILVGIMPLVSYRNALFMKNEMAGIDIPDEVLDLYPKDGTRQQGEEAGIRLAKDIMAITEGFADGYYFSFPFNRVHMLNEVLK